MDDAVEAYLDGLTPARRRRNADAMLALMDRVTGLEPRMWATCVGYGSYHYKYASGHEGDAPAASFAARKTALTVYLVDGVAAHEQALGRLGPHSTGVSCVYVKDVDDVDLAVLEEIVRESYSRVAEGNYAKRAAPG